MPAILAQETQLTRSAIMATNEEPVKTPVASESEEDDPALEVTEGQKCRRRGCGATFTLDLDRKNEQCIYHPGLAIFHEGSKGWSCCKKRVFDFDDFLSIAGCTSVTRHMFVGRSRAERAEELRDVR